jgi:amphi-Trp domain-containing protein
MDSRRADKEDRPMASTKQFEYESYEDNETVQRYLASILDGFKNGRINLNSDEETISLKPNGLIQFRVKVQTKARANKLSIKMQWKEPDKQSKKPKSIEISS